MLKQALESELLKFLLSAVGLTATYVLGMLGAYLNNKKKEAAAKLGIDNYNRALLVAKGMYSVLEDEFKAMASAGENKKAEMEKRLLELIPELTQDELNAINKQIWTEFNKDIVSAVTTGVDAGAAANEV